MILAKFLVALKGGHQEFRRELRRELSESLCHVGHVMSCEDFNLVPRHDAAKLVPRRNVLQRNSKFADLVPNLVILPSPELELHFRHVGIFRERSADK